MPKNSILFHKFSFCVIHILDIPILQEKLYNKLKISLGNTGENEISSTVFELYRLFRFNPNYFQKLNISMKKNKKSDRNHDHDHNDNGDNNKLGDLCNKLNNFNLKKTEKSNSTRVSIRYLCIGVLYLFLNGLGI